MFLTTVLLKRVKSKFVMVSIESVVTKHRYVHIREKLGDKYEGFRFDPLVQAEVLYKERKKIRSM